MSDMLSGSILESAPLEGDDFQSLLPLLPGVVRDGNGRLSIRGGQPTQGALQISSASLIDPSTGDFDLDLPAQSVQSVEVLANPFAAEYGRFSTSVTEIRTRRGTNEWEISPGNLMPRFRGLLKGIRGFEPRLSVRGPYPEGPHLPRTGRAVSLRGDTRSRAFPTSPRSICEASTRSRVSTAFCPPVTRSAGGLILFPREVRHVTMNTFRPIDVTPDFNQSGWSAGAVDRFAIWPDLVVETTLSPSASSRST